MRFSFSKKDRFKGMTDSTGVIYALEDLMPNFTNEDVLFLCVGTDRSTGDSLAPYIGSQLVAKGYKNVLGTLDEPVHAMNLTEIMDQIAKTYRNPNIIAIDACLGQLSSVGTITAAKGQLRPGAGVNKELPSVGDYYITGVVNVGGFMEYFVLQNTRLSLVVNLANIITEAIIHKFPLNEYREQELLEIV